MAPIERVFTDKAPKPLPQFSQAVKHNGMVYCSGNIGFDPATWKLVDGGVKEQTVGFQCVARACGIQQSADT
jgi:2-iminobutanoate/2-iminopropanoate deaminase